MSEVEYKETEKSIESVTKRFINKVINGGGTVAGAQWAAQTLDPFHDCPLPLAAGFPDGSGMDSINQTIKKQVTIPKSGNIATPKWDCHIILFPWITTYPVSTGATLEAPSIGVTTQPMVSFYMQAANFFVWSALTAIQCPAGEDPIVNLFANNGHNSYTLLEPDSSFIQGSFRLQSQAFEVRSVGADLFKSGTCVMWRLPTPDKCTSVVGHEFPFNSNSPPSLVSGGQFFPALVLDGFPSNEAAAVIYPDSVTGLARDGCYVVAKMNTLKPSISDDMGVCPLMRFPDVASSLSITAGPFTNLSTPVAAIGPTYLASIISFAGSAPLTFSSPYVTFPSSFDMCGAMFLGLNDTDVLTITVKWVLQRYPSDKETDLVVLAKTSPEEDNFAVKCYSAAISDVPVGVPVRMNSMGDWFRDAIGAVADVVSENPVFKASPIGRVASIAAPMAKMLLNKEKKVDKKVSQIEKELKDVVKKK